MCEPAINPHRLRESEFLYVLVDTEQGIEGVNVETMSPIITRLEMNHEEYDAAIAACEGHTTITAAPEAPFRQDTLCLGEVTLQVMEEGGANVYEAGNNEDHISLCVGLPGPNPTRFLGVDFDSNQLGLIRPGDTITTSTKGICRHSELILPVEHFIEAVERCDPRLTERMVLGNPHFEITGAHSQKIISLISQLLRQARAGTALRTFAEQQAAIEELVSVFIGGIADAAEPAKLVGRARKPRSRILKRAWEYLHTELGPPSVAKMAEYTNVSERTLRDIVSKECGITPRRLIILRQLSNINTALRHAESAETVSNIAARYGVWDWGELSRRYRSIYGELPSETLADQRQID